MSTVDDNPAVLAAKARLDQARVNLERTVLRAPFDGVIAQRSVEIGQQVQTGVRLMTVVPIDRIYVDANFKEGQLQKVRPGQHVELTSDLYGSDVVYTGRVEGFAGGSGSAFAAIPAQNATGNWIKVVQRLPVRIWIDPEQLKQHPLRVGLSMEATVDLRDHGESQPVATR
ncbi:HlyD family efflux transporter periplasmic adaptor subunit [Pseudomonas aeruginosa]|uniref:HlyD family secretion protein n=1 Tax=Pseudomonas aeruginosa TaxID=287 RepID=UPI003DA5DE9A